LQAGHGVLGAAVVHHDPRHLRQRALTHVGVLLGRRVACRIALPMFGAGQNSRAWLSDAPP
jgi:hypothetical protein